MVGHPGDNEPAHRNIALLPKSLLDWIFAGALFLIALGLALHHGWSKIELFWAVWISSLAVAAMLLLGAYLSFAVISLRHAVQSGSGPSDWAFGITVYFAALAAAVLPVGAIYWFAAGFVSSAILAESAPWATAELIEKLLETYWPIVLAGMAARAMDVTSMLRAAGSDRDDWGENTASALVNMIRTALLSSSGFFLATFVFVFAVLFTQALGLETGWWLYALVFAAFYILPARPIPPSRPDRAESVLDEQTLAELSSLFPEPALSQGGRTHRFPDYRSLYRSPAFSRFAEELRFAGEEERLKSIEIFLTQKVMDERATGKRN